MDAARAAKIEARKAFEGIGEVVGVGLFTLDHGYGVKVNLAAEPAADASPPIEIGGVPIRMEVVGRIRKL